MDLWGALGSVESGGWISRRCRWLIWKSSSTRVVGGERSNSPSNAATTAGSASGRPYPAARARTGRRLRAGIRALAQMLGEVPYIVVIGLESEPSHPPAGLGRRPLRQQHGLAVAGGATMIVTGRSTPGSRSETNRSRTTATAGTSGDVKSTTRRGPEEGSGVRPPVGAAALEAAPGVPGHQGVTEYPGIARAVRSTQRVCSTTVCGT